MKKLFLLIFIYSGLLGQMQSKYETYPGLVFREVFNSETDTRANGGTPTSVTYSQGKGTFNGSSSNIAYKNQFGVKYVRIKLALTTTTQSILTLSATHSITVSSGTISATGFSSPTIYVNGVASSTITTAESEIVVRTATAINANLFVLGKVSTNYLNGTVNYIELGNRVLSASEVSNLYNNLAFKDLQVTPLINFDSRTGVIRDLTGKTITNTATTIKRNGSIWSADFNGTTSTLNYGNIDPLTGNLTICGWIKQRDSKAYFILYNGASTLRFYTNTDQLRFLMNTSSTAFSLTCSFPINKWTFFAVTRSNTGVTNFYVGDSKTAPSQSGNVNQNSGTPVAGSDIIISRTNVTKLNGLLSQLRIYQSILTLPQITQIWSSTVNQYVGD